MTKLFVNNLTVIDFSYLDAERGVVGESWMVDIALIGSLDEQGMVFDFGHVKKQIKQFIDAEVDHRLLVPINSSGCNLHSEDDVLIVEFPLKSGGMILHKSPPDAVLRVDAEAITSDQTASELQSKMMSILPDNVTDVVLHLRHEEIEGAYYHYTHGLQKHLGQCQRIAHGHRSQFQVFIDGERNAGIESSWANKLNDGFIATEAHILEEFERDGIAHMLIGYSAQQGNFSIGLPSKDVFVMPMESTVENIAGYLAELIAKENHGEVLVRAYEGFDKGAIGEACFVKN